MACPEGGLTQCCKREHEAEGAASLLRDVVVRQDALRTGQHERKPRPIEGCPGHRLHREAVPGHSADAGTSSIPNRLLPSMIVMIVH